VGAWARCPSSCQADAHSPAYPHRMHKGTHHALGSCRLEARTTNIPPIVISAKPDTQNVGWVLGRVVQVVAEPTPIRRRTRIVCTRAPTTLRWLVQAGCPHHKYPANCHICETGHPECRVGAWARCPSSCRADAHSQAYPHRVHKGTHQAPWLVQAGCPHHNSEPHLSCPRTRTSSVLTRPRM